MPVWSKGSSTDHYVLLISGSKAFSYAGQRIGVSCISDKLYHRTYSGLTKRYGGGTFGTVFIHRVLYALSSGTSHSAQYALAAMLKAANEGKYNFLNEVKVYGERARRLKEIFLRHGFHLVYDNDLGNPVADGFYFTIGYPGMTSGELAKELMYYGVRDEEGKEKNTETQGIFLRFYHLVRMMDKNIEIANGLGLGCREHILNEVKRQTGKCE